MDVASFAQHCSHAQQGSPEMKECVLGQVQEYVTFKNMALFTYLALVAVVGLLGNSLILVVYFRRSKKTATIVFINAIAVTDLLTNLLVIPVTYYVLMNSATVEAYMCRMYYFLSYSTATTSVVLLLAVAVVRYRKICVPFGRQVTVRLAKIFSIGIAILCIVLCIPRTIVTGRLTVEVVSSTNLTIYECAVDDDYANSIWPKVVTGFSILTFLLCCVPLTVMYSRICIEAQRRRPAHELSFKNNKSPGGSENGEHVKAQAFAKWKIEKDKTTSSLSRDHDTSMSENPLLNETDLKRNGSSYFNRSSRGKNVLNRATVMLITIPVIYILTNLTTLVLIWVRSVLKIQISSLDRLPTSVFSLFLFSFVANSAVNAIIYIALDKKLSHRLLETHPALIVSCNKFIQKIFQLLKPLVPYLN